MKKWMTIGLVAAAAVLAWVWRSHAASGDLPDPVKTPGAVNPDLSLKQFRKLCHKHEWTTAFRPPEEYTYELKKRQLQEGYGGYGDKSPHLYEEDHLIPLCLGGAPRDERNLWPEPWAGAWGAETKDDLEDVLCRMACNGKIDLAKAQKEIARDWIAAYKKYVKHPRKKKRHVDHW
jgi:hypothetical protein